MTDSFPETNHGYHSTWTLFDYLLTEMGSSAQEKGLRHDQKLSQVDLYGSLSETAASLGLNTSDAVLNLDQAVRGSGNLTPLVRPLSGGAWLVLSARLDQSSTSRHYDRNSPAQNQRIG